METKEYIYGRLNNLTILQEYSGLITDTAKVTVNDKTNKIFVDVIKVPHKLSIKEAGELFTDYDGSTDVIIDLTKYATQDEVPTSAQLIPGEETNDLVFYDNKGEEKFRVSLSPFVQRQADLGIVDPNDETFVKNKSTKYLKNEGEDGSSTYATQEWVTNNAGKIDSVSVNGLKVSIDENKNVDIDIPEYMSDSETTADGDNVYLHNSYSQVNKGSREENKLIPLANQTNAGLMSTGDVRAISDLQSRVGNLEGKTTRLLYTEKVDPTAEEINAFVTGLGYTAPFEGIAVVIDKTYHIWHYYENDSIGWKDDGLDTVNLFTNENAGIIKGSNTDGKIYAENDGTGSVYGWGDLKGRVTNNESKLAGIEDGAQVNKIEGITVNGVPVTLENKIAPIIIPEVELDNQTISRNSSNNKLQAIGLTNESTTLTFAQIYQALSIERGDN